MNFDITVFLDELKSRKAYVDNCLKKYLVQNDAYPPVIHEAMHYAIFNGGKRIRPIMVFEGALIAGGRREEVILAACAVEMIHAYSLVHDDLPAMDNDDLRRGKPTCHCVYGEANAILTGDALLTAAFEMIAQNAKVEGIDPLNVLRVIEELALAVGSRGMIGGQVIDLESEGKNIDYQTLRNLHNLKTGELFRASLRAGAILAGISQKGLQALDNYARHFGLAFQITDDILDVNGDENLIGKPVGSDARNVKTTYTSLFGLAEARKRAEENVGASIDALSLFAAEADFLRRMATYIIYRNN